MITKLLGAIIFLFILLTLAFNVSNGRNKSVKQKIIKINNNSLYVEIADTDSLRSQGLSGRLNMRADHGMLFVFPTPSYYRFWMKDMKFPLDFIWVDKNTVIDITENVAPPASSAEILQTFTAKHMFDKVIEVNAGVVKSLNIQKGNPVE